MDAEIRKVTIYNRNLIEWSGSILLRCMHLKKTWILCLRPKFAGYGKVWWFL